MPVARPAYHIGTQSEKDNLAQLRQNVNGKIISVCHFGVNKIHQPGVLGICVDTYL